MEQVLKCENADRADRGMNQQNEADRNIESERTLPNEQVQSTNEASNTYFLNDEIGIGLFGENESENESDTKNDLNESTEGAEFTDEEKSKEQSALNLTLEDIYSDTQKKLLKIWRPKPSKPSGYLRNHYFKRFLSFFIYSNVGKNKICVAFFVLSIIHNTLCSIYYYYF